MSILRKSTPPKISPQRKLDCSQFAHTLQPTNIKPNTHRRRRRDETVLSRRVGGVYMNSQLAHDDCRRIR